MLDQCRAPTGGLRVALWPPAFDRLDRLAQLAKGRRGRIDWVYSIECELCPLLAYERSRFMLQGSRLPLAGAMAVSADIAKHETPCLRTMR